MKLEIETREPTGAEVLTGLHQTWLEGQDTEEDLQFTLTCGAGLGSPHVKLFVKTPDAEYYDDFDIRDLIPQWIEKLRAEPEAAE